MSNQSNNILITGVSSGIGYGLAKECISRNYRVFGSIRKQGDADKLLSEFGANFIPLLMDVTRQEDVNRCQNEVEQLIEKEGLLCLVNNSGIALGGPLQHQSMEEIERQFDVNVIGLVRVTKAFLPLLGASFNSPFPPGRIINISSVGGKIAAPFVAAYNGTKHAVEGLSASLRRELLLYGIDVIIIGPGAVKTPIWDKGIKMKPYEDTDYAPILKRFGKVAMRGAEKGLTIEYLGKEIANIIESDNPKTRYAFVPQKFSNWTIPRLLPDRYIDNFFKKNMFKKSR